MTWENAIVTTRGMQLWQRVLEGKPLILDYASGGTGTVSPDILADQTALVMERQRFPIIGLRDVNKGKKVGGLITNRDLNAGYHMTQYGIWAHVDNNRPILLCILQDSVGMPIPSRHDIPDFHFVFHSVIDFNNEAQWEYTIDPALMRPRVEKVDPTTSTHGAVSQFYFNESTQTLFVCVDTQGGVFTWREATPEHLMKSLEALNTLATNDEIDSGESNEIRGWSIARIVRAVRNTLLAGFAVGQNVAVVAGDRLLAALGKLQGQINALVSAVTSANRNADSRVPLDNIGAATGGTLPVVRGGTGVGTLDQNAQQLFNRRYFGVGGAARLPCYGDETMGAPGHTTAEDLRRGMGAVHNNFLGRETVSGTFNGGSWDIDRSGNDVSLHIVINSSAGVDVVAHTLFNIPDEYRPIRNHHVRWTVNATATSLGFVQIQNNGNVTIHGTVTRVPAAVNRHFDHTYVCAREGG